MKGIGCGMVILGVVAIVVSYFVIGDAFQKASDYREVAKIELQKEGKTTSEVFDVSTERLCQIEIEIDLTSRSIDKRPNRFDETKIEDHVQYEIPFSFRILDDGGTVIFRETRPLSSEDLTLARLTSEEVVRFDDDKKNKAELSITFFLEKFQVEEPAKIKIEAELGKDTVFKSEVKSVKAVLYDNVSKAGATFLGSLGTICIGIAIIGIGGIVFLIGLFQKKPQVVRDF